MSPARKTPAKTAPPPADLVGALEKLEAGMNMLVDLVGANATDPEGLASAQVIAGRIAEAAKFVGTEVDRHLLALLGKRKEIELADGRKLQKFSEPKETWIEPKVNEWLADVIRQHTIDLNTGESKDPADVAVEVMRNCMAKAKPKKQAMKAHGVNPLDFVLTEWSDPKVRIVAESETMKAIEKTKAGS